ncbi:putative zinc finger protein [Apostichopus japonicus]|uniref:Putative zinc finger protein n=1 Tax=Stichopus japonicus TaxID=307972 RepID=A0A2G8L3J3_STIJA|nr:putative zinc finger protein [Apostichopus japonicus]
MDGATEFTNQGGKAPSYDHNKTLLDLHQEGEAPVGGPIRLSGGEILEEFARDDDVPRCSQNGDSMQKATDSVPSMDVSTPTSEQQCNVTELPGILDLSSSAFTSFESDLFGSPDRDLFLSHDGGERSRSYPPSPTAPRSSLSKADELTGLTVLSLEGGMGGLKKGQTIPQLPSNWLTAGLEISAKEFQTIRLQDPQRDEENEENEKDNNGNDRETELANSIMILNNEPQQVTDDRPTEKRLNNVETSVSELNMSPLLSDTTSVLGEPPSPLVTGDSESTENFPFAVDLKQLASSLSPSIVGESSTGQTSDQSNGLLQKIQVTVDPKAIQSIPVETIGGSNDVQWLVETLESGGGDDTDNDDETQPQTYIFPNLVTPEAVPLLPAKRTRERSKSKKDKSVAKDDSAGALNMWLKKNQPLTIIVCPHPDCGMEFTSKTKFEAHSTTHAEDRPYKCPFDGCEWSFPSRTKLHRHLASHDGIKPYTCLEKGCGKQFGNPYNLKTHKKCHHQSMVFCCVEDGCSETFQSKKKLEIHLREHYAETRLKCPYPGCEETFMTPNARGSHLRKHGQETKEFCCEYEGCDKVFDKLSRLVYHTRSHTGERPYKCTFTGCKWAFTTKQKLKRHECRHTGRKDFCCPVENCGKSFTRKEHLQSHEVFHRGELPFECKEPGCNARFSQRSSMAMHRKRHSSGKSHRGKVFLFSCPLDDCNNSFSSKVGLKNHMIKGHMDHLPMTDTSSIDLLNSKTLSQCMVNLSGLSPATVSLSNSSSAVASLQHAASSVISNQSDTVSVVAMSPTSNMLTSLKDPDNVSETVQSTIQIQLQDAVQQLAPEPSLRGAQGTIHKYQAAGCCPAVSPRVIPWRGPRGHTDTATGRCTTADPRVIPGRGPGGHLSVICNFPPRAGLPSVSYQRRCVLCEGRFERSGQEVPHVSHHSWGRSRPSSVTSSVVPTSFVLTSSPLTLRDPTTGAHFIQNQLLQDDPPDDTDISFPLVASASTSNQSSMHGVLPVSSILGDADNCPVSTATDFLGSDGSFEESTINLQDLA